jgi:hypothetical protein
MNPLSTASCIPSTPPFLATLGGRMKDLSLACSDFMCAARTLTAERQDEKD